MRPKIVLANGVFDVLHIGHLWHLQAAKDMGDLLIVGVTRCEHVNKGPGRPVFDEWQRFRMLRELRCVDHVLFVNDALDALNLVKPAVFVKGKEYRGKIEPEHQAYCDAHGIEIAFTNEPTYSSTELLRYYESRRG